MTLSEAEAKYVGRMVVLCWDENSRDSLDLWCRHQGISNHSPAHVVSVYVSWLGALCAVLDMGAEHTEIRAQLSCLKLPEEF